MTNPQLLTKVSQLRKLKPALWQPFTILLNNSQLTAVTPLRLLPGKRLTINGLWQQQKIVAKLFFDWRAAHYLRREIRGHQLLKKAGILTPPILYHGTCDVSGVQLIIFPYLLSDNSTSDLWKSNETTETEDLLANIQQIIIQQHQAGIYHNDLHPSNFLYHQGSLFTLDTAAIQGKLTSLGLKQSLSLQNLASLYAQLASANSFLILPAFQRYCQAREWAFSKKIQNKLLHALQKARRLRLNKWNKKIFRSSSEFIAKKCWRYRFSCQRNDFSQLKNFLQNSQISLQNAPILKNGNTCTVFKINLEDRTYIVKRYNIKSIWHLLSHCWRKSRAEKSWRNANMLNLYNIPTAKPIAYLEKRYGLLRLTSYFISDYIEGELLNDVIKSVNGQHPLIDQAQLLMQMLENLQFSHGDLKATNFILKNQQIFLLDLDSMRQHRCSYSLEKALQKDRARFRQNWE